MSHKPKVAKLDELAKLPHLTVCTLQNYLGLCTSAITIDWRGRRGARDFDRDDATLVHVVDPIQYEYKYNTRQPTFALKPSVFWFCNAEQPMPGIASRIEMALML